MSRCRNTNEQNRKISTLFCAAAVGLLLLYTDCFYFFIFCYFCSFYFYFFCCMHGVWGEFYLRKQNSTLSHTHTSIVHVIQHTKQHVFCIYWCSWETGRLDIKKEYIFSQHRNSFFFFFLFVGCFFFFDDCFASPEIVWIKLGIWCFWRN